MTPAFAESVIERRECDEENRHFTQGVLNAFAFGAGRLVRPAHRRPLSAKLV
jgi:hypothetical protein